MLGVREWGELEGARGSWGWGSGSLSLMVALNVAVRSTGLGSLPCRARPMEGKANGSRLVGGTDSPTAEAASLSELLPVYKGSGLRHTAIGLPMTCSHPGPHQKSLAWVLCLLQLLVMFTTRRGRYYHLTLSPAKCQLPTKDCEGMWRFRAGPQVVAFTSSHSTFKVILWLCGLGQVDCPFWVLLCQQQNTTLHIPSSYLLFPSYSQTTFHSFIQAADFQYQPHKQVKVCHGVPA